MQAGQKVSVNWVWTLQSGKPVVARLGRFGPMVQIGAAEEEEKPRFAKLRTNQSIETITLEEAMELFRLPRKLGLFEGEDVVVNIGRFGPYAQHAGTVLFSEKRNGSLYRRAGRSSTTDRRKKKGKAESEIKVFEKEKIRILKGPYGPYIKQGLRNYKIPKEKTENPAALTIEEVKAIIEEVKANPPKKVPRGKKK